MEALLIKPPSLNPPVGKKERINSPNRTILRQRAANLVRHATDGPISLELATYSAIFVESGRACPGRLLVGRFLNRVSRMA